MTARELFEFVDQSRRERGWGRTLRERVAAWYLDRPVAEIAVEILRCPEHKGYTHRDLLRLSHPKPDSPARNAMFQWAAQGGLGHLATPDLIAGELRQVYAVERLKGAGEEGEALMLIEQYALTPDLVPAEWKRSGAVWETLVERMSGAELARNLIWLASAGVLDEGCPVTALVVARLMDARRVRQSGISMDELRDIRAQYERHPRALKVVIQALDAALCPARVGC
jgi:60 kDa SS-A/Ro ribonucleoprotein